jgi:uncharacterized RDD family membrane protein YckC
MQMEMPVPANPPSQTVDPADEEPTSVRSPATESSLIGDGTKARYLAAVVDYFAALVIAFLVAANVPAFFGEIVQGLSSFVFYFAYFFGTEWLVGATPAKFAFGLRVRSMSGAPCSAWQALVRTILRLLEVNPLLFGGLPAAVVILASKKKQRVGDMLARTVVVSVR